jgi:hypothetical protein
MQGLVQNSLLGARKVVQGLRGEGLVHWAESSPTEHPASSRAFPAQAVAQILRPLAPAEARRIKRGRGKT